VNLEFTDHRFVLWFLCFALAQTAGIEVAPFLVEAVIGEMQSNPPR
jgi:hypothetical protein